MITTNDTFTLNILPNGVVEVKKDTVILDDGVKIAQKDPWRCVLDPGDYNRASSILPYDELNIVQAVWTPEKVQAYQEWKTQQEVGQQ